ncbi:hypothetical protein D3C77_679960 [compost metagenome]
MLMTYLLILAAPFSSFLLTGSTYLTSLTMFFQGVFSLLMRHGVAGRRAKSPTRQTLGIRHYLLNIVIWSMQKTIQCAL